jgi:hypothetical protein
MTSPTLHEATIEQWMLSVIQDGGVDRYDDLHLDHIDPRWRSRELWISAGVEAFQLALSLRDRHHLSLTIALAFSLEPSSHPRGFDFTAPEQLQNLLDWSPPSLYLFRRGQEPWLQMTGSEQGNNKSQELIVQAGNSSEVLGPGIPGTGYLLEFRQPASEDYSRTFFVAD